MSSTRLKIEDAAARLGAYPPIARVRAARERRSESAPEWPCSLLFIAGLPKSGTTWLAQLLEEVPGYKRRSVWDPDRCIAQHDVCDSVFESVEPYAYSVVKLHTRPTPENLAVLRRHHVRTVVMHRDLRDQCVSRYFHALKDPEHQHHDLYESSSKEEGLAHSVEVTIEHYRDWVSGWLPVIEAEPEAFFEVRYEDLHAEPVRVLSDVLGFYGIDPEQADAAGIVERVGAATRFELTAAGLARNTSTAREGGVGGWRRHFTPEMTERFSQECGDLFARLGYPV
jgi:hypothetical protein